MNLFDLAAKITLNTSDYENKLNSSSKKFSNFGQKLKSGLGTAAKIGTAAIGAITTATAALSVAFIKGANDTAEYGDNIDKMSQKLGLSTEAYQKWDYVIGQAGGDIASMSVGLKTLTNQIGKAKDGSADAQKRFQTLGISLEQLRTMSREEVFEATIKGFQGMADSTERAALANELFGRSGQELTPLFNQSVENTEKLMNAAEKYGFVLSENAIKASADFHDALDTLKRAFQGVKNGLAGDFLPTLTTVMKGLTEIFSGDSDSGIALVSEGISGFLNQLTSKLPDVLKTGSRIVSALLGSIVNNLDEFLAAGKEVLSQLLTGVIKALPDIAAMLPDLVRGAMDLLTQVLEELAANANQLIPAITKAVLGIVDQLTNPATLGNMLKAAIILIQALGKGLIDSIPLLTEKLPQIIDNILQVLTESVPLLIDAGVELFVALVENLPAIIDGIIVAIPKMVDGIVKSLDILIPKMVDAGIRLFSALVQNTPAIIKSLVAAIPVLIRSLVSGFGNFLGTMKDVGKNLINGIWEGIKGTASWLWNKVKGFFGNLLDKIKNFLGIHSPSTVTGDFGVNLARGIPKGFAKTVGEVTRSMNKSLGRMMGGLNMPMLGFDSDFGMTSGLYGTSGQGISGGRSGVTIVQNIYSTAKTAADLMQEARWQQEMVVGY